jgi:hypothetical protein
MLLSDRQNNLSEEPVMSLKATKVEKQKILDEVTGVTDYHRKHAIRFLKNQRQVQKP